MIGNGEPHTRKARSRDANDFRPRTECSGAHLRLISLVLPAALLLSTTSCGLRLANHPRYQAQSNTPRCDGGNGAGCDSLSLMYDQGTGNEGRAVELYRQGCNSGSARNCALLGDVYAKGRGVERDEVRAVQLYKQGCDGGSAKGCALLGDMYARGRGVAKDVDRANRLYKRACDGGSFAGCTAIHGGQ